MTPTLLAAKANFVDIDVPLWAWGALLGFIVLLLVVDLVVFHKEAHDIKTREAAIESIIWVSIGLSFTFVIWWGFGGAASGSVDFLAGHTLADIRIVGDRLQGNVRYGLVDEATL